jgi:hypothetical protein
MLRRGVHEVRTGVRSEFTKDHSNLNQSNIMNQTIQPSTTWAQYFQKIQLKHLVLATLILILIVPVFNTSHLYGRYSDLEGIEKVTVTYFLGITFEIAIFICVLAGYRPAGIFFAIISFLIGLLYHIQFDDIRTINFYHTHSFISKVVIQIGINSLVYFLSELYVILIRKETKIKTIKDLTEELKQLEITISEKLNFISTLQSEAEQLEKVKLEHQSESRRLKKESEKLQTEITELTEEREHLRKSIIAIKRESQKQS